eukprot:TRINITY_DN6440_c0_g1_i5.p1 TRINITY_DN6440_c0_g1~~TRINITY_DN6440_c0_g1_i5.p1  ORF type:complete len:193 (-),score=33.56 TRINITY_DN6440_c0_g1_i5:297-875(-)
MGFLWSKIWDFMSSTPGFKVIMCGLNNAGKTTTLYKLFLDEVVATKPTIGSNVEEIQYKDLKFLMWDIGGQESSRATWASYYSGTSVIIFVLDSTDRTRLPISKQELHNMLSHEQLRDSILLVFSNKNDLKGAMTSNEVCELMGLDKIKNRHWHIQSCCALTGEGYQRLLIRTLNVVVLGLFWPSPGNIITT